MGVTLVSRTQSHLFLPLFTEARRRGVLGSSATGHSRKLAAYGAVLHPDGGCGQLTEALRSGALNPKGDRTAVACFLSLFPLPEPAAVEDQRGQRAGVDETRVQLVVFQDLLVRFQNYYRILRPDDANH
jgi:hypothetical protein